jgi:hypothetical protein
LHHVISIGALLAKAKGSDSPVAEDTFGDVATAVLAVATAGLLFAAIWAGKSAKASVGVAAKGIQDQINEQRLIERRRRTYELLSAYYAPDFAENVGEARPLATLFKNDVSAGVARWKEMTLPQRGTVTSALNFYELVATEYNFGFIDRDVANKHLAYLAVLAWVEYRELVGWFAESNPRYFEQWRHFYNTRRDEIEAASGLPTPVLPGGGVTPERARHFLVHDFRVCCQIAGIKVPSADAVDAAIDAAIAAVAQSSGRR